MSKNIIIIGAGIGGLSSGIRLLNKGFKVTIIEKNETIGGKINLLKEKDFQFDLTASVIMTPKSYTDVFTDVNKNYRNYFKIIQLDPIYRVFYHDKSICDFYSDNNKMVNELEKIEKGLSVGYFNFIAKSYKKYFIIKHSFLDKPMIKLREVLNLKSIKALIKINPLFSTSRYIKKIIKNEKLRDYLIFTSMYIGVNPYTNSNIHTLIPAISHIDGLWYIEGGIYKYIEALEKLFIELGGKIIKNNTVEKVLVNNKKILGVKTKNKIYKSDIVICNCDYTYVVNNLLENENINNNVLESRYNKNHIKDRHYSCSVFILYLGLDKIYNNLKVNNIYINKNLKENMYKSFKGDIPINPSLYMYYPSIIDSSFNKKHHSCLNIMLRIPNLRINNIKYDLDNIKLIRNIIINNIKNIPGMEDIENHIVYENYLTPIDLQQKFNCYLGNAFGLSHKLTQNIYFRPHLKSKKIKGLYFLNASTHPGNGASVVLDGSKVLSEIIEDEYKQK